MILRYFGITAAVLAGLASARASVVELSFSGTFDTTVGVIASGTTFSGEVTFNTTPGTNACPGSTVFAICLPLLTDELVLSGDTGLSIPPDTPTFQGVPEVTEGVLNFSTGQIQINVESTVDDDFYSFYINPASAGVVNDNTDSSATAVDFQSSGLHAIPEPSTLLPLAIGILVFGARLYAHRTS